MYCWLYVFFRLLPASPAFDTFSRLPSLEQRGCWLIPNYVKPLTGDARCFKVTEVTAPAVVCKQVGTWLNWTWTCLEESMPKRFTICLSLSTFWRHTDNEAHTHTLSMRGIYDWWPVWAGSFRLMRGNYPSWQVVWCHRVMNLEVRPQKRHIFHLFCRRGYSRTPETTVLREGSLLYLPNSEFVRQNGNVQQLEEWRRWFSSQTNREEKWWHWLAPWIRQRLSITEQL